MPGIVEYLNSIGQPSDFQTRSKIAQQLGIQDYSGSPQQDQQLVEILNNGGSGKVAKTSNNSGDSKESSSNTQPSIDIEQLWSNAAKTGITREQFDSLNDMQQATISALGEGVGLLYSSGSTGVTVDDALKRAASDPAITAKYADTLKLDQSAFADNLNNLQLSISTDADKNRIQFANDKRALDEAAANAGTAYSGFREKASENLATTEAGIVQSSRAVAQKNLDTLRQNFAQKYGSAATPDATATFNNPTVSNPGASPAQTISGNVPDSVLGSAAPNKSADIASLAETYQKNAQLPTF